jgi:hypothetical protein
MRKLVVDDAIRIAASHVTTIEKSDSDKGVTVVEEVSNSNDIHGSEKSCCQEQQQSTTTNNLIF